MSIRISIQTSFAFVLLIVHSGLSSCPVDQTDSYMIKGILENLLINDCRTMFELSGIFFENQEKPPNTVRVTYKFQIPLSSRCSSECSCWEKACGKDCDTGYCCFERDFIWGRIPTYVQDSIFRQMTMCSLVVGGNKEKVITIPFNISDEVVAGSENDSRCIRELDFPCSWCHKSPVLSVETVSAKLWVDTTVTFARVDTPLDKALLTLTAKLQGYAAKAEKLEWLVYSSELAFGYSDRYNESFTLISRLVMFVIFYGSFQVMIFMLVYKYRYRMYNKICQYINKSRINRSLFWSFILTTMLAYSCVIVISLLAGGICISVLQLIMLGFALSFGVPHASVVCFRMKKITSKLELLESRKSFCLFVNMLVPKLLFSYVYLLPHITFFALINFFVSFVSKPFSYLLLLVYFCVSNVFIWVANAIGINLLFPISFRLRGSDRCRRQLFAVCLITACNCLNFTTWGFIEVYFYDRRAHATTFMTILPGTMFTLLGWYLSGDLVKLFDMIVPTFPVKRGGSISDNNEPSKFDADNEERKYARGSIVSVNGDELERSHVDDCEEEREAEPRKRRYNFTRLKKMMRIIQSPKSVVNWNDFSPPPPNREDYTDIDELPDDDDD